MPAQFPDFRLGKVLATSFTATLIPSRSGAQGTSPLPPGTAASPTRSACSRAEPDVDVTRHDEVALSVSG
ncbi:hypothetical protein [Promicromonospora soli]